MRFDLGRLECMQEPWLLHAGYLADMVASRQLFAFHLPDMCDPDSPSAALYDSITEAARTGDSLLSIMGYFPKQEVLLATVHAKLIPLPLKPACFSARWKSRHCSRYHALFCVVKGWLMRPGIRLMQRKYVVECVRWLLCAASAIQRYHWCRTTALRCPSGRLHLNLTSVSCH